MTYDKEVEEALGTDIYEHFLDQVDAGRISKTQATDIATKMHSTVGGNFRAASQDVPNYRFDRTAARQILSDWY